MNQEIKDILLGFRRVWQLMHKNEKFQLLFATSLMLVAGILTNIPALILGRLVDTITVEPNFQFSIVIPFIILIITIILVRETLTIIRKYVVENIVTQTEKKQTVRVVEHLLKSPLSFLNQQQIGSLHGRIFRSIQGLVRLIKLGFLEFFPVFFSALAAIVIALTQKPLIASIMILVIPVGLFIIIKQISSQKGIRVSLLRGKEKIDGKVVEMLGGIETIRVSNTHFQELQKVEEVAENLRQKEIRHHLFMALFDATKYLNEGFFYIIVISLAILLSAQGAISKGDILVYSILFLSVTGPLREIHRILDQAHESSINVSDLYDLLNQSVDPSFIDNASGQTSFSNNPIIEIKSLSFTFPNNDLRILHDINLVVKSGEKIGIVGASGCGKSTFIKLLLRLYTNYQGSVKLFGKDLAEISREEIAEKIAYVPQNTYIFSGTIKENITYGISRQVTSQEIIEAAKKAQIYNEITRSLGGFDGRVEENGRNLSGGQKQRLAVARLILKSPDLFIFDEATSALDNTNEAKIQREIDRFFKDRTIITIAHRLSTLKNSDRILVFEKGRIIQEGTFKQLSIQSGLFKQFLQTQDTK